jgi:hypothetical protein
MSILIEFNWLSTFIRKKSDGIKQFQKYNTSILMSLENSDTSKLDTRGLNWQTFFELQILLKFRIEKWPTTDQ